MEDTSEADGAPLEEDSVESTEQDTLVTEEELSDSDTSNSEEDSADAPLSCLDFAFPQRPAPNGRSSDALRNANGRWNGMWF